MKPYRFLAAAAALALAAPFGAAQAGLDGAALYKAKTCSACHGKDGKSPVMKDYPKIAGQNREYIIKQMKDIKTGARSNGNSAAMKGIMHLVSDAEIEAIADYVSKMAP